LGKRTKNFHKYQIEAVLVAMEYNEKGFAMAVFMRKVFSKPLLQNQCCAKYIFLTRQTRLEKT
jgi:hypothetical protein